MGHTIEAMDEKQKQAEKHKQHKQRENRTETVRARVTLAERIYIEQQAEAAGLSLSDYVRQRGLDYAVPAKLGDLETTLISELNAIGSNVNQIARGINSGRPIRVDPEAVMSQLRAVLERVAANYGA